MTLSSSELALLQFHAASSEVLRDDGSLEFKTLIDLGLVEYAGMADAAGTKVYAVTFSGLEALLGYDGGIIE